jgi:hypothetical protein
VQSRTPIAPHPLRCARLLVAHGFERGAEKGRNLKYNTHAVDWQVRAGSNLESTERAQSACSACSSSALPLPLPFPRSTHSIQLIAVRSRSGVQSASVQDSNKLSNLWLDCAFESGRSTKTNALE